MHKSLLVVSLFSLSAAASAPAKPNIAKVVPTATSTDMCAAATTATVIYSGTAGVAAGATCAQAPAVYAVAVAVFGTTGAPLVVAAAVAGSTYYAIKGIHSSYYGSTK
ncbi:MAG: hypothetical protein P4L31_00130 [Candidatus Babeliales bacterium]|nr:hypothetical protein [Candidatus Babeliales bacterium]